MGHSVSPLGAAPCQDGWAASTSLSRGLAFGFPLRLHLPSSVKFASTSTGGFWSASADVAALEAWVAVVAGGVCGTLRAWVASPPRIDVLPGSALPKPHSCGVALNPGESIFTCIVFRTTSMWFCVIILHIPTCDPSVCSCSSLLIIQSPVTFDFCCAPLCPGQGSAWHKPAVGDCLQPSFPCPSSRALSICIQRQSHCRRGDLLVHSIAF